jgi:hypothetical protein
VSIGGVRSTFCLQTGQSGNPAGKPPGTRTAFSQGFIRDFALVWAEEGLVSVREDIESDESVVIQE